MNEKLDMAKWNFAINSFGDKYPGQKFNEGNKKAYWIVLQYFIIEDVERALIEAAKQSTRFMPSAADVRSFAAMYERERRRKEEKAAKNKEYWTAANPSQHKIPTTQPGQEQYISEANQPFEKLARIWECESKAMGILPNARTPDDIVSQRLTDFWQTWDKVQAGIRKRVEEERQRKLDEQEAALRAKRSSDSASDDSRGNSTPSDSSES